MNLEPYLPKMPFAPFRHQMADVVRLTADPYVAVFSEMGTGKSKVIVDTANILFDQGEVDAVVVVAPAACGRVWADTTPGSPGQILLHSWVPARLVAYQAGSTLPRDEQPTWVVVSYELLRQERYQKHLAAWMRERRPWLVLDEATFIKNRTSQQTKACDALAQVAVRRTIMTGSPIANNPLDLWAPVNILNPKILPFTNYFHFRHRYAIMGGFLGKQPITWINQEELRKTLAPHVIRHEKKDCLDLLPKIYKIREVALSSATWKIYLDLREECLANLGEGVQALAPNAAVRVMRLSQVTAGFVGGLGLDAEAMADELRLETLNQAPVDIGSEKTDDLLELLKAEWLGKRVLVWARFRHQLARLEAAVHHLGRPVAVIQGGQSRGQRSEVFKKLREHEDIVCLAQQQAGGFGLNDLLLFSEVVYASDDYNLLTRQQSEDRSHRAGQLNQVTYVEQLAVGPKGQKTVDHAIYKAQHQKLDLARLTTDYWRSEL